MSLTDRINNHDRRTAELAPIVERRNGDERRVPAWIKRKNEQGIARDETGRCTFCAAVIETTPRGWRHAVGRAVPA